MATATQKEELSTALKANEVIVDTTTRQTGTDQDGFPTFETVFENPPPNYKLVRMVEPWKCAILEDLTPNVEQKA